MRKPFAEAVAQAGSLQAQVVRLREGRAFARAEEWRTWPGGDAVKLDPAIPKAWWAEDISYDIEPAAGQAKFKMEFYDLVALGIDVDDGAAVEALPPAKPKPPGSKRGAKPSAAWGPLLKHLDRMVKRGKIANPAEDAFSEAKIWLENKTLTLTDDALRKGIKRYRPQWFEA